MSGWSQEDLQSFRASEDADRAAGLLDDAAYRMAVYGYGAADDSAPSSSLRWQWANELEAPDEPEWIWGGYVAPGAITLVVGKPKFGKSTLTCALAEALDRHGRDVPRSLAAPERRRLPQRGGRRHAQAEADRPHSRAHSRRCLAASDAGRR